MDPYKNDIKLNIHPLVSFLEKDVMFFAVAYDMMSREVFQNALKEIHGDKMTELELSVTRDQQRYIRFHVGYALNEFNKDNNIVFEKEGSTGNLLKTMTGHAKLLVITLFDLVDKSLYKNEIQKRDIYKALRHFRNASAHDNKFFFEGRRIKSVMWRNKIIKTDLEGEILFGNFIFFADIMVLLQDLSDDLFEIDIKLKIKFIKKIIKTLKTKTVNC